MDKKKIIEIILVVAAFSGSAFVIYNGFFKQSAAPIAGVSPLAGVGANVTSILPYGNKLDFSPLSPTSTPPFQFDAIVYPALNASTDVGVLPQDLININSGP